MKYLHIILKTLKIILKAAMITIASSIIIFLFIFITSEWWFPGLWGSHPLGDDLFVVTDDDGRLMLWYSPDEETKVPGSGTFILPRYEDEFSIRLEKIERAGKYLVGIGTWNNGDSVFCYVDSNFIRKVLEPDYQIADDVHYTSSRDSLMMCISR